MYVEMVIYVETVVNVCLYTICAMLFSLSFSNLLFFSVFNVSIINKILTFITVLEVFERCFKT